jgi:hypothetical protein
MRHHAADFVGAAFKFDTALIHYTIGLDSATLHRLSESGRIPQAHRRAVGQFVSTTCERSRGGPISRSGEAMTLA